VAYDESEETVRAFVWLYATDESQTEPYHIEWRRRRTPIVLPKPCQAHEYRYEHVDGNSARRVYEKAVKALPGQTHLTII
jgi:hypothetical protein